MRIVALIPILAAGSLFGQLPEVTWSAPVPVTDGTTGNRNPSIALTTGSVPVVMWGSFMGDIFVSRLQGGAFSAPVQINPADMSVFTADWAAPNVAAQGNNVFAAFKELPEDIGHVYLVKSTDGGLTFGDTVRVDNVGSDRTRFAAVAIRQDGNPVVAYMRFNNTWGESRYMLSYSNDGGNSFQPDVNATDQSPDEVCDCCQGFILSQDGREVLLYRGNDNNIRDAWLSWTEDFGSSFTAADIDESDWFLTSCPSSGPSGMIAGDTAIVTWMTRGSGGGKPRVIVGTVSLATMQVGFNLKRDSMSAVPNQNYPALAGSGDTIGLFWHEFVSGNVDVFMSYSIRGAAGLNDSVINVSDAPGGQNNIEAAYAGGVFHIVWQDNATQKVMYQTASFSGFSTVERVESGDVQIVPNPVSDKLEVIAPDVRRVTLLDASGRIVLNSTSSDMDVSQLPLGVYFVRVEMADGVAVRKMVKF